MKLLRLVGVFMVWAGMGLADSPCLDISGQWIAQSYNTLHHVMTYKQTGCDKIQISSYWYDWYRKTKTHEWGPVDRYASEAHPENCQAENCEFFTITDKAISFKMDSWGRSRGYLCHINRVEWSFADAKRIRRRYFFDDKSADGWACVKIESMDFHDLRYPLQP